MEHTGVVSSVYPPNKKFLPVVQQVLIAYRTRKLLTLRNSTMSVRSRCNVVSAKGLTGLSSPIPYSVAILIGADHSSGFAAKKPAYAVGERTSFQLVT